MAKPFFAPRSMPGATAAQVALGPRLGRQAWLLGAVGGVLPDADIVIRSSADPLLAIQYHRHFTHALAFIPVGGIVATLPWLARQASGECCGLPRSATRTRGLRVLRKRT